MAKVARTMSGKSPLSGRAKGGKLALFEVLASAHKGNDAPPEAPSAEPAPEPAAPPTPSPSVSPSPAVSSPSPAPIARPAAPRPSEPRPLRIANEPPVVSSQRSFSPMTIAMAAAAVVAVVGIVYVAGRPGAEDAVATAEVPSEVMPEVLDVESPGARVEAGGEAALARNLPQTRQKIEQLPDVSAFAPTAQRTNGLNYVLVQSYHASEADRAEATIAALAQAGIHATIERDVPGWPKRLCIVGVEGFERIRNNGDFQEYIGKLDAVSDRHRSDRKIKSFDPQPIHWSRG